jgi:hypothetical protein
VATLLEWWNLVFLLPFALAVVYYLVLATGTVALDHEHDADHDHEGVEHAIGSEQGPTSSLLHALSFLGIGRAPLSIVLTTFCLVWGFVGYASNQVLDDLLAPAAFARQELQGHSARVRFEVTETFGSAVVVDQHRFPHEVDCRVKPGEPPIPVGASVYLLEYDPERNLFFVMTEQKLDDLVAAR